MHVVLVNRLGGLSLPWKSVVTLTDRPDMTIDCCGRKTTAHTVRSDLVSKFVSVQQSVRRCFCVEKLSFYEHIWCTKWLFGDFENVQDLE